MHQLPRDPQDEDVFVQIMASAPEPAIAATTLDPAAATTTNNTLDDIFGSDNTETEEPQQLQQHHHRPLHDTHPSDIHRLQSEHATNGYREGIAIAKSESIQAGFDEGFSLGATVGLRAGQLLGYLEGIEAALRNTLPSCAPAAARLLEDARAELCVEAVFSERYWNADGTWKYAVKGEEGGGEGDVVVFEDVANAHPLISKWSRLVEEEVRRWNVDCDVLRLERDSEPPEAVGESTREVKFEKKQTQAALDW